MRTDVSRKTEDGFGHESDIYKLKRFGNKPVSIRKATTEEVEMLRNYASILGTRKSGLDIAKEIFQSECQNL